MKIKTRKLSDKDLNDFEVNLLTNIKEDGWQLNAISEEDPLPNWAYSIGIYAKYGQPELILFGLDFETMYQIVAQYIELIQEGLVVKDKLAIEGLIEKYSCVVRKVQPKWREKLLLSANWYYHYQDYPALQCFWPDKKGLYPWQDGFNRRMQKLQPLLYERTAEKTLLPEIFVDEPWKFDIGPDSACFTSQFVLAGSPITYASRDFDGDWQFHGDEDISEAEPNMVGLGCMIELDSSLEELHDLPRGWGADRKTPRHKWQRFKNNPFPDYDSNGYYLEDVVELAQTRSELKPPSEERREKCRPGDCVKLLFRFAKEDTKRKEEQTESLWVKIVNFDEDQITYAGEIIDTLHHKKVKPGDRLEFHPLHIAEIRKGKSK